MYIQNEGINPLPESGVKMRKGMKAKLNISKCFTPASGGQREFPVGKGPTMKEVFIYLPTFD